MGEKELIQAGKTSLGIEFGSTRIKAVLIDAKANTLATGNFDWENQLSDGIWTYSLDYIWQGLQECFQSLVADVKQNYGIQLETIGALGFSAMMHGYMAFDHEENLLVPFRTWRDRKSTRLNSSHVS